ncbi:hypothetical protein D3C76_1540680 [compost metagenome]
MVTSRTGVRIIRVQPVDSEGCFTRIYSSPLIGTVELVLFSSSLTGMGVLVFMAMGEPS